ncbi:cell division protein FtsZ [Spiroplasma sp. TIUS-1]|uniref:cell division protein FtsZ n=1 Tax=Spiroplasma sp. TIUS-1 TaxID=216963 RepID=UPI0013987345|nr:cell division protein FtsZ [Spiroplasma sp. TIUS-1]QHX35997.1 cell division protein FtsZ [Spiroplasma sp. TIUS-1]
MYKIKASRVNIKVIGVGGGGCNSVNKMLEEQIEGVDFIVSNTDEQVLSMSKCQNKITLGQKVTSGMGAGAEPEIGRLAAIESENEIRNALAGAHLVFITAGMGGGTGTGAAPEIARIAMEQGALVIAIVTKPFNFENRMRMAHAIKGIEQLKQYVDSIITISNEALLSVIGNKPITHAFEQVNRVVVQGVKTITDLISVPALINLDFADIKTVMKEKGDALFGIGIGAGEQKAIEAANKAVKSLLLETEIRGSKYAIVNITGGLTTSLNDANDAVDIVQQAAGEDINIIFGLSINEELNDEIIVTVIATRDDEDYINKRNRLRIQNESKTINSIVRTRDVPLQNTHNQNQQHFNESTTDVYEDEPTINFENISQEMNNIPANSFVQTNVNTTTSIFTNSPHNQQSKSTGFLQEDTDDYDDDDDVPTFLRAR